LRVRSPLLAQSLDCFLFLQVLRCFSSLGSLSDLHRNDVSSIHRVAPFGNLRINSYLRFPVAYRSLSRPSSPLRAKASPIRPSLLLLTNFVFHLCPSLATGTGLFLCARLIVRAFMIVSLLTRPLPQCITLSVTHLKLLLLLFLQHVNELLRLR
jgi:hypothetical protein